MRSDDRANYLKQIQNRPWLKAELHVHTSEDFWDGKYIGYSLIDFIKEAKKKRYDIVAVTNHHTVPDKKILKKARAFAEQQNILLIPGAEVTVSGKHVLVYFDYDVDHKKIIESILTIGDIAHLKNKGVIRLVGAAHPFYMLKNAGHMLNEYQDTFDFIELSWYYTNMPSWLQGKQSFFDMNVGARRHAKKRGLPLVANGDLHKLDEFTKECTFIRCNKNLNSFFGTFHDIKRLGLRNTEIPQVIRAQTSPLSTKKFIWYTCSLFYTTSRSYTKKLIARMKGERYRG